MPSLSRALRFPASTPAATLIAAAGVLLAGCATTASTPAVYCVNAPGAGAPPASVTAAYCVNLPRQPAASAAVTSGSVTPPSAVAASSAVAAAGTEASGPATAASAVPRGALKLAPEVDLNRFMGRWYVIAFIPYVMQNGRVGAYYEFKRLAKDEISFDYYSHWPDFKHPLEARTGSAQVMKNTHGAKWKVTFEWPIKTDFPILYVDPGYTTALIGYPKRKLGWVLSRTPQIDNATYQALLARFASQGYDTSEFQQVPQSPEQIGN